MNTVFDINLRIMGLSDVLFVPPENLSDTLKELLPLENSSDINGISVTNILKLAETGHFGDGALHELLEKCELHFCVPPREPRNAELEERINRLKAEQSNEEYRSMTKFLLPPDGTNISIRKEVKFVTAQITAVINFVLTVGGSFCFAYKAVEYALPKPHIPAQVMMGILTSSVVALADLYFLVRNTI